MSKCDKNHRLKTILVCNLIFLSLYVTSVARTEPRNILRGESNFKPVPSDFFRIETKLIWKLPTYIDPEIVGRYFSDAGYAPAIAFDKTGDHFIALIPSKQRWSDVSSVDVILNGKVIKTLKHMDMGSVMGVDMSPDGRHFAYVLRKSTEKVFAVLDHVEQPFYQAIEKVGFDSKGNFFYLATVKYDAEYCVVKNGTEQKHYVAITDFVLHPNGYLTYVGIENAYTYGSVVIVDGVEKYSGLVGCRLLTMSPDGTHLAFVAGSKAPPKEDLFSWKRNYKYSEAVYLDGSKISDDFIYISEIALSPKGNEAACVYVSKTKSKSQGIAYRSRIQTVLFYDVWFHNKSTRKKYYMATGLAHSPNNDFVMFNSGTFLRGVDPFSVNRNDPLKVFRQVETRSTFFNGENPPQYGFTNDFHLSKPVIASNGKAVAYVVTSDPPSSGIQDRRCSVILNRNAFTSSSNHVLGSYYAAKGLTFDSSTRFLFYIAEIGIDKKLCVNGTPFGGFNRVWPFLVSDKGPEVEFLAMGHDNSFYKVKLAAPNEGRGQSPPQEQSTQKHDPTEATAINNKVNNRIGDVEGLDTKFPIRADLIKVLEQGDNSAKAGLISLVKEGIGYANETVVPQKMLQAINLVSEFSSDDLPEIIPLLIHAKHSKNERVRAGASYSLEKVQKNLFNEGRGDEFNKYVPPIKNFRETETFKSHIPEGPTYSKKQREGIKANIIAREIDVRELLSKGNPQRMMVNVNLLDLLPPNEKWVGAPNKSRTMVSLYLFLSSASLCEISVVNSRTAESRRIIRETISLAESKNIQAQLVGSGELVGEERGLIVDDIDQYDKTCTDSRKIDFFKGIGSIRVVSEGSEKRTTKKNMYDLATVTFELDGSTKTAHLLRGIANALDEKTHKNAIAEIETALNAYHVAFLTFPAFFDWAHPSKDFTGNDIVPLVKRLREHRQFKFRTLRDTGDRVVHWLSQTDFLLTPEVQDDLKTN
jgi:hypothetical protein